MFDSRIIEVALGLVLVYLMFSLVCSAINEWIARFFALRATGLRYAIDELLANPKLTDAFHTHSLIEVLKPGTPVARWLLPRARDANYPSYIPASTFASVIMDLAMKVTPPSNNSPNGMAILTDEIKTVNPKGLLLPTLLRDVEGDVVAVRARLEQWFNESMERVSGWYKRRIQVLIIVIAAIVAVGFNVDTIRISRHLFNDRIARTTLANAAQSLVDKAGIASLDSVQRTVASFADTSEFSRIPIGWPSKCSVTDLRPCEFSLLGFLGLALTTLALAQGAPFWFEALNKVANLRQRGKPPDITPPK